jgi:hypothetical protein
MNPVALGDGLSIFGERGGDSSLELLEAASYPCGVAVIRYRPRGLALAEPKARTGNQRRHFASVK